MEKTTSWNYLSMQEVIDLGAEEFVEAGDDNPLNGLLVRYNNKKNGYDALLYCEFDPEDKNDLSNLAFTLIEYKKTIEPIQEGTLKRMLTTYYEYLYNIRGLTKTLVDSMLEKQGIDNVSEYLAWRN